jgi:hypothetical protein
MGELASASATLRSWLWLCATHICTWAYPQEAMSRALAFCVGCGVMPADAIDVMAAGLRGTPTSGGGAAGTEPPALGPAFGAAVAAAEAALGYSFRNPQLCAQVQALRPVRASGT